MDPPGTDAGSKDRHPLFRQIDLSGVSASHRLVPLVGDPLLPQQFKKIKLKCTVGDIGPVQKAHHHPLAQPPAGRLKAMHLNDSMNPLGSHKDRHEKIGEGMIGLETFRAIVTHPKLKELPFFLETPNDLDGYQREIALLRQMAETKEEDGR